METRTSILFYSKCAKKTRKNLVPIYLRVTINGQRFEATTQRYIEQSKWSSEAGRMKGNSEEARSVNSYLDMLRSKVYAYQREIIQEGSDFSVDTLKQKWKGSLDKSKMLCEIFEKHNNHIAQLIGRDFAKGTLERYKTSLDHTRSFLKWKYGQDDFPIDKLNYDFISSYEFWLKTERHCSHNTALKYIGNFKKIVNICLKNGWLQQNPFAAFKMAKKEVVREFLSEHEILAMREKAFGSTRLTQVRDIFLFCCYTGLCYADIKKLRRSEIGKGCDGEQWIFTYRQKTETQSRIPILPAAQDIINNYANHPVCINKDRLLPVLSNQKMNSYLKEIADLCEINKELTFHIARHTFATTVTLGNGVPIETVSKMLGHTNIKMTQHYAKILDKKVSDDMMQLREKLSKKYGDQEVYSQL